MVAYSFQKRFAARILAGIKAQTIRADRKRHARPGEQLQLFTGIRTKHCRRLGEPMCTSVSPIQMRFSKRSAAELFCFDDRYLTPAEMEAFARADGFMSIADMAAFWWAEHPSEGGNVLTFEGFVIRWEPLVPADDLDIAVRAA